MHSKYRLIHVQTDIIARKQLSMRDPEKKDGPKGQLKRLLTKRVFKKGPLTNTKVEMRKTHR